MMPMPSHRPLPRPASRRFGGPGNSGRSPRSRTNAPSRRSTPSAPPAWRAASGTQCRRRWRFRAATAASAGTPAPVRGPAAVGAVKALGLHLGRRRLATRISHDAKFRKIATLSTSIPPRQDASCNRACMARLGCSVSPGRAVRGKSSQDRVEHRTFTCAIIAPSMVARVLWLAVASYSFASVMSK